MIAGLESKFDEILVSVAPVTASDTSPSGSATRKYEALVYTNLGALQGMARAPLGPDRVESVGGLRLVAIEEITVRWRQYQEYLRLFHEADKSPDVMQARLLETMSSGLERIFDETFSDHTRVWWSNESPELEDLPWELVAHNRSRTRVSFARGRPGEFAPVLPIPEGLRLAVIGEESGPPELRAAFEALSPGVHVQRLGGPARAALHHAAKAGFELVHLVTDGSLSMALDGILELRGETLSARELRGLIEGSRVTIVGLSPPESPRTYRDVPSVYRAFAHLGGGAQAGATLVAPVGPILASGRVRTFWSKLYRSLAERLSVERALLEAQRDGPVPVALFLRHRLGVEFTRRSAPQGFDPARVNAQLKLSRQVLQQFQAIDAKYSSPERIVEESPLVERERQRLEALDAALEEWQKPERGGE